VAASYKRGSPVRGYLQAPPPPRSPLRTTEGRQDEAPSRTLRPWMSSGCVPLPRGCATAPAFMIQGLYFRLIDFVHPSYFMLRDFVHHSTLGLRVIQKKKHLPHAPRHLTEIRPLNEDRDNLPRYNNLSMTATTYRESRQFTKKRQVSKECVVGFSG